MGRARSERRTPWGLEGGQRGGRRGRACKAGEGIEKSLCCCCCRERARNSVHGEPSTAPPSARQSVASQPAAEPRGGPEAARPPQRQSSAKHLSVRRRAEEHSVRQQLRQYVLVDSGKSTRPPHLHADACTRELGAHSPAWTASTRRAATARPAADGPAAVSWASAPPLSARRRGASSTLSRMC